MSGLPSTLQIELPLDEEEVQELEYIDTIINLRDTLPSTFTPADISEDTRNRLTLKVGHRTFTHQLNALPRSLNLCASRSSYLLIGGTGTGKTYYYAGLFNELRRLMPHIYPAERPILFVTDTKVVLQTAKVFKLFGCVNIQVLGYESLRSSIGSIYIDWKTKIEDDRPTLYPVWVPSNDEGAPCAIACDECQKLKNDTSQISHVIRGAANAGYQIIFSSATPFSRAYHVRTIATSLAPIVKIDGASMRLTNKLYPSWLSSISDNPMDWNPADIKRVMRALDEQIVKFEHVVFAHLMKIRQIILPFKTQRHREIYDAAFNEYQLARIAAERDPLAGRAAQLVAMQKFEQKSELLRGEYLADSSFAVVNSKTRPVNCIIACKFLDTIFIVKEVLMKKHGVSEDCISMIVGGQSGKERQININRFNNERARYCLISVGAGGTGLSLHHTEIKKFPTEMMCPPIWNSEDYVQLIGRGHRINSLSTTYLNEIWFGGTIEETVAARKKQKCASLKEVVGSGERWILAADGAETIRSSTRQIDISKINEEDEDEDLDMSVLDAVGDGNANASVHKLMI